MEQITPQNQENMPQTPRFSGPNFESGAGWGAKLKKNFFKWVLPIIIVIVAVIGLIMFLNRETEEVKLIIPEIQTEEGISIEKSVTQEGGVENIYKADAQKGEGITHLARKVLKNYLQSNPVLEKDLTAEHKIYIEDYLKDLRGDRLLALGEEIEFSANDITTALEKAMALSDNELNNLSQYVALVSGL